MNNETQNPGAGAGSQPPPLAPKNAVGPMPIAFAEGGRKLGGIEPKHKPDVPSLDLDASEIDKAAKALGFNKVRTREIAAAGVVGNAIRKVGAIRVGRTQMLLATENIQETIQQLDDRIALTSDPEQAIRLLEIKAKFTGQQAETGFRLAKTAEIDHTDDAGPPSGYASGFQPKKQVNVNFNAPVQVNNKVEKEV